VSDHAAKARAPLSASAIREQIAAAGVRFVAALPDITTSEQVLKPLLTDPTVRVVQVCKEDEGISICAGLYAGGERSVLMMQHTGLLDSINCLRAVAVEGANPVCMLVGLLRNEPGLPPTQSPRYGLRIVQPILGAMGVEHELLEFAGDEACIAPAIERAYERQRPVVLLVGGEPV
jgi:sulfopyruvate decarboxylase TPP-binding subunit